MHSSLALHVGELPEKETVNGIHGTFTAGVFVVLVAHPCCGKVARYAGDP